MGTSAIKTIVLLIFLSVLAFVAGSLASEGAKQAVMPIGLVVGAVVLLCLGRHCWVLVFVLPPLYSLLGLPTVSKLPIVYVFATLLLVYWLILYSLGRAQITWHKLPVFDSLVLLFCVYFLFTWVRNPVTLNLFVNPLTDTGHIMVGGAEYVWCVFAMLFYVFMSIIPINTKILTKLLRVVFWISLILLILGTVKSLGGGGAQQATSMGEEMQGARYGNFDGLGRAVCNYLACSYSVGVILCSPLKMGMYIAGMAGIALSGFRSHLLDVAITMFVAQYLHRKLVTLVVLGGMVYGGLLLFSSVGGVDVMPYGVKRIMSSIPGMKVDGYVSSEAQHSLDWRYEMWEWAMDPSTGYIKDYIWGDGFGLDWYLITQRRVAESRGSFSWTNREFASTGVWHSGWITAIHRTGIVGLVLLLIVQVAYIVYTMRVCYWLRNIKYIEYMYFSIIPGIASIFLFHVAAGTFMGIFSGFYAFALMKIFYSQAIKEGLMPPMFQRKVYVPLIQREIEHAAAVSRPPTVQNV